MGVREGTTGAWEARAPRNRKKEVVGYIVTIDGVKIQVAPEDVEILYRGVRKPRDP